MRDFNKRFNYTIDAHETIAMAAVSRNQTTLIF